MHQWNDGLLDLQQVSDNNRLWTKFRPHDTEFLALYVLAASAGCAANLRIYIMRVIQWITKLSSRWRIALGLASLIPLLILLYPFGTTTVPEWNLRILDDAGAAVRGIKVTEHWQNYLLEASGHEDSRTTNEEGRVGFPARDIRASLLGRLTARIGKIGSHGDPGRIDLYGSVVVWGSKQHTLTVAVYREGELPQAEIRVQRRR